MMTDIPQNKNIAIIMVNYNGCDIILKYIEKNLAEFKDYKNAKIYIVDNASPKGDAKKLQEYVSAHDLTNRVEVIAHCENEGFASGNNVGIRKCLANDVQPDYYFFLNPDAYFQLGCLEKLIEFMASHPQVGICGPKLMGEDGVPQISAFRFFSLLGELNSTMRTFFVTKILKNKVIAPPQEDRTFKTDWVSGAAFLVRPEVLTDAGLMDETYFLYYEESDWMLQAMRKNWETWYVHTAEAIHLVGQTTGVKDGKAEDNVAPFFLFQSRQHYFLKNHGVFYTYCCNIAWFFGTGFFWLRQKILRRPDGKALGNMKQFFKSKHMPRKP